MTEREAILKGLSILYVEDEPLMRMNLGVLLGRRVREVRVAENGQEGLEIFRATRPDLVLTDIEMPVMNGLDMIREIRKISDCPIVILTAFNDAEHNTPDASMRLIKPVYKDELFDAIVSSLKVRRDTAKNEPGVDPLYGSRDLSSL